MIARRNRKIAGQEAKGRLAVRAWRALVMAALSLLVAAPSHAADEHTASMPPGGDTLPMARFYSGSPGKVGDFPGTLVCLRCDLKPSPGAMAQCEKEGHRHALSMDTDSMVHPLLAGNQEVLKEINSGELHGKRVIVHGVYYPATGAIFVDRVSTEK